ncbi:MAG: winged helix-turn-helix domain-containing protein [Candidatus Bathyarchaeia archaeon]
MEEELRSLELAVRGLRDDVVKLREELRRMEASVLAEKLRGVENAVAQRFIRLYAEEIADGIEEEIDQSVRQDCERREDCKERFKASLRELVELSGEESIEAIHAGLDAKTAQVEKALEKAKNTRCEACFRSYHKAFQKRENGLRRIAGTGLLHGESQPDKPLDTPRLFERAIEPLANPTRLVILTAVHHGRRSFSELSEVTGMKGGHLTFHLTKLARVGLIAQDGKRGGYIITSYGVHLLNMLRSIQATLCSTQQ